MGVPSESFRASHYSYDITNYYYFLVVVYDFTILDGSVDRIGIGGEAVEQVEVCSVCLSLSRQITAPWKLTLERVHVSAASQ